MSLVSLFSPLRISLKNVYPIWNVYKKNVSLAASDKYEEEIRNKILAASLPFVIELGWTKECLSKGAEQVGYPGISHGMFTRGAGDLVHYFNTSSNEKLVETLKQFQEEYEQKPITPGEFVELAIAAKLKMLVPYKNRWPQAIAIMSLPPNVPNALAALLAMVDDICYYAGDRSVDFNWYMRRLGVAGVYKATELYLIQDKSENHADTMEFLKRRMEEAVQLHDIISKSDIAGQGAKDVAKSAFVTILILTNSKFLHIDKERERERDNRNTENRHAIYTLQRIHIV
ncbi:ubiquinone biosynthesis protein COQ9, mitochondrial-like isoform X3 [Sitophilus oryzae]|uniref:Ubiquinone biosynthesis protein n=1 Tax=Sitophilus oryzae TaxID=7048 RepID=A0A6J2XGP0_SITOR|nr:ubiquinone biosynthesis protein COQ9, mitochondrial-like isoform X3 [Sitophilus oryzae]